MCVRKVAAQVRILHSDCKSSGMVTAPCYPQGGDGKWRLFWRQGRRRLTVTSWFESGGLLDAYYLKEEMHRSADIERTMAIIKPKIVWSSVREILKMAIEPDYYGCKEGRKLHPIRMQLGTLSRDTWEEFYGEHKGKTFFDGLIDHMVSGPSIFMVLEGPNAVAVWRKLCGATDPNKAAQGTIRFWFGNKGPDNAVHGSATREDVVREVEVFARIQGCDLTPNSDGGKLRG